MTRVTFSQPPNVPTSQGPGLGLLAAFLAVLTPGFDLRQTEWPSTK